MRLSIEGRPSTSEARATIHSALDSGLRLIDTADAYHIGVSDRGHNEELIASVVAERGDLDRVLVATKGGKVRPGNGQWLVDGRPEHLKLAAKTSATRLRRESIGLYQLHAPDPQVPFAESVGALMELVDEGVIENAGISNVSTTQIEIAHRGLGAHLVSVQNRFSPTETSEFEAFEMCQKLGLIFMAWRPFGDVVKLKSTANPFVDFAMQYGVSLHRLILAWELSLGPEMVPIPGATRPATICDSALAPDLKLDSSDIAKLSEFALKLKVNL